jgi:copper chaperone
MNETTASTYFVEGMTCGHCRAAVAESVNAAPGVESAEVDLESGRLAVRGSFEDAAIEAAVREAGYRVAGKL